MTRTLSLSAISLLLTACGESLAAESRPWAEAMQRFEQADELAPPSPGGVVFVGSSSIRLWDLERSFGDNTTTPIEGPLINRGFGGSQIADSVREIDLLVLKHKPRLVVVYAGDNDIAAGKSASVVAADFRRFVEAIRSTAPRIPIAFIAIKPSVARRSLAPEMLDANRLIETHCKSDERLTYVDIWTPMLGSDGEPRLELLAEDGLHLSEEGYAVWAAALLQALEN